MHGHNPPPQIETERLLLRQWRDADREPFAAMCADPRVMEFFPSTQARDQSDAVIDKNLAHLNAHGFGFWAMEVGATGAFAGLAGLKHTDFDAHFTPTVELGWRLRVACWGKGLASEAAKATLSHGFDILGLPEIVAVAAAANRRSRAVMERIGMNYDAGDDFIHPLMAPGHPLQPCVLYRIGPSGTHAPSAHPQNEDMIR